MTSLVLNNRAQTVPYDKVYTVCLIHINLFFILLYISRRTDRGLDREGVFGDN